MHELQTDPEPDDNFEMLTFNNIQISSLQSTRDEAFVKLNVRLTSRPGIHKLVLKWIPEHKGTPYHSESIDRCFQTNSPKMDSQQRT